MSRARDQVVLRAGPGTRTCLLGNTAIVRGALEAGVQFVSCYPGTPSSEIGDTFARIADEAGVTFEYSVNEKIAVEIAFAACLTGARSLCSMKHLGLNYANDPISSMPYVGVEGGMLIVSAGDPSAITSPNEQDQRHFNRFLFYPIFDPATPADSFEMTRYAFAFSEKTRLPVIIRPTTRICHGSGMVELGSLPSERNSVKFTKDPPRYVPIPANAQRMRKELAIRFRKAEELLGDSPFFPRHGAGKHGVLASGIAHAYVSQVIEDLALHDEITVQKIGAYPIPDHVLIEFLESVDSVLVVEELTPFVEELAGLCAFRHGRRIPILGKHSGHLPAELEYSPDIVERAMRAYLNLETREPVEISIPHLPPRPAVLCAGCPHRASLYLARRAFGKQTVYCNDIGCYTLGYGDPLHACDVLLCMGSSISQASGIARMTGKRTVAFIGDSTFFHSGLPALVNAVQANDKITVIILDNYITAMTGFQPSPTTDAQDDEAGTPREPESSPRRSIEDSVLGLGVTEVYSVDPFDVEETLSAFKKAKAGSGVNVVVCHSPCVVHEHRSGRAGQHVVFVVDPQKCDACSLCVRLLGCPAILVVDGEYVIDRELCDGCALCAEICQRDAIRPEVECHCESVPATTSDLST